MTVILWEKMCRIFNSLEAAATSHPDQVIGEAARQIIANSTAIQGRLYFPAHVVINGPASVLGRHTMCAQLEDGICDEVYHRADAMSQKHSATFGVSTYNDIDLSEVKFLFQTASSWSVEVFWDPPSDDRPKERLRRRPEGGRPARPDDHATVLDADQPTRLNDETEPAYMTMEMSLAGVTTKRAPITARQLIVGRGTGSGLVVPARFERVSREALTVTLTSPTTAQVDVSNRAGIELLGSHHRRPTLTATVIPAGQTQILGIGEELRFQGVPDLKLTVTAL